MLQYENGFTMTKIEKRLLCIFVVLLIALTFTASLACSEKAQAAEVNTFFSATCTDFNGNSIEYDMSSKPYARDIILTFDVPYDYYFIQLKRFGASDLYIQSAVFSTVGGKAVYAVTASGYFSVFCYGCDANGNMVEESVATVDIKSDVSAPDNATVSQMTEWVSMVGEETGTESQKGFLVNITVNGDDYSGVREARITTVYPDRETSLTLNAENGFVSSFKVRENCRVIVDIYDRAGNCNTKFYEYNKFDNDAPTAPQIICTPTPAVGADTNGYTRSCTVMLSYGTDALSGTKSGSMKYTLNGTLLPYEGSFVCDTSIRYTITAYYFDNAGNQSPVSSAEITNIDDVEPTVHSIRLKVDLTQQVPYALTVSCSDTLSGIKSVIVDGLRITATKKLYNDYEAIFSVLDRGSLSVTVTDLVGNYTTSHISTYHFDTIALEEKAVSYHSRFLALDSTLYNADAWDVLLSKYTALNILYMAENSSIADFNNAFAAIDTAIAGKVVGSYSVESAPETVSANITYTFDENDLFEKKLGDTVRLRLAAIPAESLSDYTSKARALSSFGTSMACPFALKLYHNDTLISEPLTKGFTVSMAVPAGYEARRFAVVDIDGNTLIESETINNVVTFNVKKSGGFALLIEGEPNGTATSGEKIKGVNVFGKTISIGALVGCIGGAVGVIVIGVVLVITLGKKN